MRNSLKINRLKATSMCLCLLLLSGCGNHDYDLFNRLDKSKEEIASETGKSARYFKSKDVKCDALPNAIVAYKKYFIAKNDNELYDIYEYNFLKKYDNEQNCKLLLSDTQYTSLLRSPKATDMVYAVSFSETRDLPYYVGDDPITVYKSEMLETGNSFSFGDRYDSFFALSKYTQYTNDQIHNYNNRSEIQKSAYPIYMINDSYGIPDEDDNGYIIEFYSINLKDIRMRAYEASNTYKIIMMFYGETLNKIFNNVIITNRWVYFYGVTDYSCLEYVDRECKNGFKINHDLSPLVEDIVFMDDSYIVFKDGRTYMYQDL